MRLAIFSDIHGNPIALEAVLRDIEAQGGADGYWIVGDFSALGFDPVTPLERIATLPGLVTLRGNTDRYTITGDLPSPTVDEAQANPELVPQLKHITQSFAWTRGYATAAGWFDWLAALPLEQRLTLPDGTRMVAVHASPGQDAGLGLQPGMTDDEVRARFGAAGADLVFVGHIHVPQDRTVDGVRIVDVASVSNPVSGDPRAHYVLLDADATGYRLTMHRVAYDYRAVMDAITRVHHPTPGYLTQFFQPFVG